MFSDAINCTHNGTGGSGTITLASVTGYPQPTDWMGTSGTRIVYYEISEYTDSTLVTLSKYERGIGSLVLSTNVLTRTPVLTWTSGGSYVTSGATKLTFGNTAANVRIMLGASAATQSPGHLTLAASAPGPSVNTYLPIDTRQTFDSTVAGKTLVNGERWYWPVEFIGGTPITTVAIQCSTLGASGAARLGVYDWDTDGLPGNLIREFTAAAQFDLTTTGQKTITPAAPIWIPPGLYWLLLQGNTSVAAVNAAAVNGHGLASDNNSQRDIMYYTKASTYAALPSTGDKSMSSAVTRSSGARPWVGYR